MIVVFRDGETKRIQPGSMKAFVDAGWSLDNPNPKIRKVKKAPKGQYPTHIGHLDIPADATPLQAQEIVLGKMHIRV
tara:strand:- start:3368 stop:3598 length:231 start_codon:yes stop_codon:yes gene_type:complete